MAKSEAPKVTEHLKGCPSKRIETYTASKPGGTEVGIIRCIDCGASDVVDVAVIQREEPSDG